MREDHHAGLMLTLKKRMSISEIEKSDSSHLLVWGNYDGLDIHLIKGWYEMRPKGVEKREGLPTLQDVFLDKYTVKLYFPAEGGLKRENPEPALPEDYDFGRARMWWKETAAFLDGCAEEIVEPGGEDAWRGEMEKRMQAYPLVSIGLLNLAPGFVGGSKDMGSMQEGIESCIARIAGENGISLEEVHCAVFPCIGYSDFVVLFQARGLQRVIGLLDNLKNGTVAGGKALVSNCYPISGVYRLGAGHLDSKDFENVYASVRINLRTGISAKEFKEAVAELPEPKKWAGGDDGLYYIFGNTDCVLIPQIPFCEFVHLYLDGNLLDTCSPFFQRYIESTNTSLCVKMPGDGAEKEKAAKGGERGGRFSGEGRAADEQERESALGAKEAAAGAAETAAWTVKTAAWTVKTAAGAVKTAAWTVKAAAGTVETAAGISADGTAARDASGSGGENPELEKKKDDYQRFIEELKEFISRNGLPIRSVNALQKVMKRYLNLIKYPHCFDIKNVLEPVLDIFMENVRKSISKYENAPEENVRRDDKEKLIDILNDFRNTIGDYLSDLQRSDRQFIDGQLLSHPSIASATKLLFFYQQFINMIAKKLVDTERENADRNYQFVVVSGGHDQTMANDLFEHLEQSDENLQSLIILSIPEMSLYDVRGTIFRLLHECFHYCGERLRRERLTSLIDSVSRYVGWYLAQLEFEARLNGELFEKVDKIIRENVPDTEGSDNKGRAHKEAVQIFDEGRSRLQEDISSRLRAILMDEMKPEEKTESDLYEIKVKEELQQVLKSLFLLPLRMDNLEDGRADNRNHFPRIVYQLYYEASLTLIKRSEELLKRYKVPFSDLNRYEIIKDHYAERGFHRCFNRQDEEYLECILQLFADNCIVLPDGMRFDAGDIPSISAAVNNLMNAEKEAYCDVMASRVLGMNLGDFILSFVYEKWDLESVFPDTPLNILRMKLEFEALFGVKGGLTEGNEDEIGKRIAHWKKLGFQYRVDEKNLVRRLNRLLSLDERHEGQAFYLAPLIGYIESVNQYYNEQRLRAFQDERCLYDISDLRDRGQYDIPAFQERSALDAMLNRIITYWSGLAF